MNDMDISRTAGLRNEGTVQNEKGMTMGQGHSLTAVNRGEITVKGVREVISFDEQNVLLITTCGGLTLEGEGLRVHVLNTGDGIVAVTGKLNGVLYEDMPADGDGRTTAYGRERGERRRAFRFFR